MAEKVSPPSPWIDFNKYFGGKDPATMDYEELQSHFTPETANEILKARLKYQGSNQTPEEFRASLNPTGQTLEQGGSLADPSRLNAAHIAMPDSQIGPQSVWDSLLKQTGLRPQVNDKTKMELEKLKKDQPSRYQALSEAGTVPGYSNLPADYVAKSIVAEKAGKEPLNESLWNKFSYVTPAVPRVTAPVLAPSKWDLMPDNAQAIIARSKVPLR